MNKIPVGEEAIIAAAFAIVRHCNGFVAMCEDNLFHNVEYDPKTATHLLADILKEIGNACEALGIAFCFVITDSSDECATYGGTCVPSNEAFYATWKERAGCGGKPMEAKVKWMD